MYIDPLTIYREYVQNGADSVDEGRHEGLLSSKDFGRVDISIDSNSRTIRIRDNGKGLHKDDFEERLTGIGTSAKRGTEARGFRGVGRLAGIGYCQELIFRSRASAKAEVFEMRWDCKSIKTILRSADARLSLQDLINSAIEIRLTDGTLMPERFFEVELRGIIRHKNDSLLNPTIVHNYLSEVAPVPFAPNFELGKEITSALCDQIALGQLAIQIEGMESPVYRPHRNEIEFANATYDLFSDLEICPIPSIDGSVGAIAWFLHHGYKGAIPNPHIRGMRLRSGNIQVGGHDLLQDLFAEARFNSWTVGEVHAVDKRIIPNGRRDHYEQNVHFNNLINHISPIARNISARCRQSSVLRNLLREFDRCEMRAKEKIMILKQGTLSSIARERLVEEVKELIIVMRRAASRESMSNQSRITLNATANKLERAFSRVREQSSQAKILARIPKAKRKIYQQVFALIYDCSANKTTAHELVKQILGKLSVPLKRSSRNRKATVRSMIQS
jgi:molecular chaperone HtpG